MQDSNKLKDQSIASIKQNQGESPKKKYDFGGIEEYSLDKIEEEILEDSVYLDVFAGSDIKVKENISPLGNVIGKVGEISCISFDYNTSEFKNKKFSNSRQIGVIAQEIQVVFPELVAKDKDGDLMVNYTQLSTVALQAIKELTQMLENSNRRIEALELQITQLSKNQSI